ncbi:MAG: class I SAM-dependent methyltransferase [Candidatus Omnitrophota bacterium]
MMDNYFLNNPVFLKYKRRFDWKKLRRTPQLVKAIINERIVEIPFALNALSVIPRDGKVLDVGCMESLFPLFASALGYQVTGFDFREFPYQAPNFTFVQGDILDLPFKENEFDAVSCVSTIEHVGIGYYSDPADDVSADVKGIKEIRRILKPSGLLILSVPFGKAHIDHQQRVYDTEMINNLLKDFNVTSVQFFKNTRPVLGNNYWEKVDQNIAEKIDYQTGTECVCCATAVKH